MKQRDRPFLQCLILKHKKLISGGLKPVLSHTEKLCIACIIISSLYEYTNLQEKD